MNLDDALLWLSDRQGKEVTTAIGVERGKPFDQFEFRVTGTLRHFKEGDRPEIVSRPDVVAGLYRVGDAVLSLAKLAPIKVTPPAVDAQVGPTGGRSPRPSDDGS